MGWCLGGGGLWVGALVGVGCGLVPWWEWVVGWCLGGGGLWVGALVSCALMGCASVGCWLGGALVDGYDAMYHGGV